MSIPATVVVLGQAQHECRRTRPPTSTRETDLLLSDPVEQPRAAGWRCPNESCAALEGGSRAREQGCFVEVSRLGPAGAVTSVDATRIDRELGVLDERLIDEVVRRLGSYISLERR